MHILTSSQTDLQTIKFAPRSIGALQYLLHLQEEESGTTFQMIGYGIQDDSYVSITRTFPLYENLYYYLRVFRLPSGALVFYDVSPRRADHLPQEGDGRPRGGRRMGGERLPMCYKSR